MRTKQINETKSVKREGKLSKRDGEKRGIKQGCQENLRKTGEGKVAQRMRGKNGKDKQTHIRRSFVI